jgi:hypothetical protein
LMSKLRGTDVCYLSIGTIVCRRHFVAANTRDECVNRHDLRGEITVSAPAEPAEIEALARRGVKRVAVPVSAAAGLPAQVRTPDDVLRYGKTMIERFRD